jgi:hypothetical protein
MRARIFSLRFAVPLPAMLKVFDFIMGAASSNPVVPTIHSIILSTNEIGTGRKNH